VLAAADLALVATGTATLEACRAAVPSIFFHRASFTTWAAGRALVRVRHLALPNLLLGRRAFPELWQTEVTGPRLAREAELLGADSARALEQRRDAAEVVRRLGTPGAAARVATLAEELLDRA
jgi:lipid-A-disaccharide synthase